MTKIIDETAIANTATKLLDAASMPRKITLTLEDNVGGERVTVGFDSAMTVEALLPFDKMIEFILPPDAPLYLKSAAVGGTLVGGFETPWQPGI